MPNPTCKQQPVSLSVLDGHLRKILDLLQQQHITCTTLQETLLRQEEWLTELGDALGVATDDEWSEGSVPSKDGFTQGSDEEL